MTVSWPRCTPPPRLLEHPTPLSSKPLPMSDILKRLAGLSLKSATCCSSSSKRREAARPRPPPSRPSSRGQRETRSRPCRSPSSGCGSSSSSSRAPLATTYPRPYCCGGSSRSRCSSASSTSCCIATSPCARRSGWRRTRRCRSSLRRRCELAVVDLTVLPTARREEEAQRPGQRGGPASLRPGARSAARAILLKLDEQEHVLVLSMHHIVSDGWSMGVLVRELGMLYAASPRASPRRCPSCRCSTPTTRCGSASGCRARSWSGTCRSGRSSSPEPARAGAAHRQAEASGADVPRCVAAREALAEYMN